MGFEDFREYIMNLTIYSIESLHLITYYSLNQKLWLRLLRRREVSLLSLLRTKGHSNVLGEYQQISWRG